MCKGVKNVIDELNAYLCLCIGTKPDYNYDNPLIKNLPS